MVLTETLGMRAYHCANANCAAARHGRVRVLLVAQLPPGALVRQRCPVCKRTTAISVDGGGHVDYAVVD